MEVFNRGIDNYRTYMNPLEDYLETMANYISKKYKLTIEQSKTYVKECIKQHGVNHPDVVYKKKNQDGDMVVETTKLMNYFKEIKEDDDIIVPSFTTYTNHKKEISIHSIMIDTNKKERSRVKKLAFEAKLLNNIEDFNNYDTEQMKRKTTNNSLSGSYGSTGTILHNESGHYTLTSLTRCVSGIGNAISEIVVGGNRYFRTPDSLINYILTVLKHYDRKLVEEVVNENKLYIPSKSDVFDILVKTGKWYWESREKEAVIKNLIENLDIIDRCAVLYINDLWTVKNFNEDFIRVLMDGIGLPSYEKSTNPLEDLKEEFEGTDNLLRFIYAENIRGRTIKYKEMLDNNEELIYYMASTSKKIKETFKSYSKFFKAFFLTDILPPNIAYIKDMFRLNIVLSDTDSTCCSYDKWVEWYYNGNPDLDRYIGIAGGIMTITTQLIGHNLKVFYNNLNIVPEYGELLQMKNEFFWPVFVVSNNSKHYFASVMIREGNVYRELEREKKGVNFISSTFDQIITDTNNELMDYITDTVSKNEKISLKYLCKRVADVERKIISDFENNKFYMFKKDNIKNKNSYKQEPTKSKYVYHLFWKEVFGEKYGALDEPPYTIYNIPIDAKSKTEFQELLDDIKACDENIYNKFIEACKKYDRNQLGTLRIPKAIVEKVGLPLELKNQVKLKKTILQMCFSLYDILATAGFYKKKNYLVSELGY